MVKRCAPTNVNSDRGFNSGRRRGNNPHPQIPDPSFPGAHGRWASATGRKYMLANMRLCASAHASRPGSFGSHGHRIDFCGSAAFYQSCCLSIDAVRNNNWSSSYCSAQRRCLNSTIGKTLRSHKNQFGDRGNRMTPAGMHVRRRKGACSRAYICDRWLKPSVRAPPESWGPGFADADYFLVSSRN